MFRQLLAFCVIALTSTVACAATPIEPAEELLKQLRQDVPDVRDCEPKRGRPFTAREIDLGTAGSPQYLLTSTPDCMCGQVNCSEWLYRRGPKKWELILETQGYSFTTRATVHHGYRDVETRSRDNAAQVDNLRYVFDGHTYQPATAPLPVAQTDNAGSIRGVQFLPGTSSIQLQGRVSFHDPQSWTVGAKKAQTLRISLVDSENAGIWLTVLNHRGSIGRPLAASTKCWETILPENGTYTIRIEAPANGFAAYTLSIDIR